MVTRQQQKIHHQQSLHEVKAKIIQNQEQIHVLKEKLVAKVEPDEGVYYDPYDTVKRRRYVSYTYSKKQKIVHVVEVVPPPSPPLDLAIPVRNHEGRITHYLSSSSFLPVCPNVQPLPSSVLSTTLDPMSLFY